MKIKINKKIIYITFTLLIIVNIFLISRSLSKYMIWIDNSHIQESTEFYFESEIATVEGKEYRINNWDGISIQKINIDIKNYLNSLLKSDEDIIYNIKAEIIDDTSDSVNDADLVSVEIYNENGVQITNEQSLTLSSLDFVESKYTLNIVPSSQLENNKEINIKLTTSSIEPYKKDLIANITMLVNKPHNKVNLVDFQDGTYTTLNLKINDANNDVYVAYDNTKLILDKASYIVNDVTVTTNNNINSFKISKEKLEQNMHYEIIFIKQENNILLGEDIVVN